MAHLHKIKGKADIIWEVSEIWTLGVLCREVRKNGVFSVHILGHLYSLFGGTEKKKYQSPF